MLHLIRSPKKQGIVIELNGQPIHLWFDAGPVRGGKQVKVSVEAPREIPVVREELLKRGNDDSGE